MATEITLIGTFLVALVIGGIKNAKHIRMVASPGTEHGGFTSRVIIPSGVVASAARIGMSAMLMLTGIAHFAFTKGMAMMLPEFVPFRPLVIYVTGIFELAGAVGLLIPRYRIIAAWALIAFLVALLPANVYAAMHHVNLETADYSGNGSEYLWYRIPLQFFFIGWIYFSAIKSPAINSYHSNG